MNIALSYPEIENQIVEKLFLVSIFILSKYMKQRNMCWLYRKLSKFTRELITFRVRPSMGIAAFCRSAGRRYNKRLYIRPTQAINEKYT